MSVKRHFWQVCICVNMLSVGYADTLISENPLPATQAHADLSHTLQDSKAYPARERKLPPSVVVALQRDVLQNPTHLSWQGRDTPLHSGDVAKSMLQIPAFSMTRKGGGGSEIAFRAQSASRLPIFLNGGNLSGACGGRMDTTITYIFPENYNRISILKGPQDVRYGALIGGGVLFDRDILRLSKSQFAFDGSALYGSFGRFDANANVLAGGKYGSIQAIYSHYESRDYRSGDNKVVHSAYNRESVSLIGTLTPTQNTALELDIDLGRGNASYADRAMDARTFDRISYNLAYKQHISDTFDSLEVRLWRNEIDHIMDNFSYRQVMDNKYNVSNPKRTNTGGRVEGKFYFGNAWELYVGGNYNHDFHASRMLKDSPSKNEANAVLNQAYKPNFTFQTLGIFAQGQYMPESSHSIAFGARYDTLSTLQHSTDKEVQNHLGSGFLRYEKYFDTLTLYSGVGVAQRGADFWERSKGGGMELKPETNSQLDMGLVYQVDNFNAKASAFMSHIADYIVLHYGSATNAFNTNAFLGGGELEAEYIAWKSLHFYGSLAYTYAENLKNVAGFKANSPLPQIPPLQGQLSAFYDNGGWLLRLDMIANAAQHRYMLEYGNVVGKDLGKTQGFVTLNLYGGYKRKHFILLAGVDNLTNTLYAYHLSKNGVGIGDIAPTNRIYEPGRSYWTKIRIYF
ncbi:TonB-dependent copper receptor [Helicobacter cinaedi]|uniref:TonB-dependent receptor domain-containing protein n=1 Tax=Helicobacter cinaedi TaxID=213 RepID=UPI001F2235F5|nr:TonB-dependent receptor [Helicobacter cinaedi]BDB66344.1 TonB-dependent copper receptor [Helicobacter cinaedi]